MDTQVKKPEPVAIVRGRFVVKGKPMEGEIWFVPLIPFFYLNGKVLATLASRVPLRDGAFEIALTHNTPGFENAYDVYCAAGHWRVIISEGKIYQMADLMPKKSRKD